MIQASTSLKTEPTSALDILNTVFGYASFQGQQAEIINHVTRGGNALVLMPTGGGKSLCYQIPPSSVRASASSSLP